MTAAATAGPARRWSPFAPLTARVNARAARWMRRRQGGDLLPVILERRRLYILPTRAGLAFTALLFLMLLAGLNYANSLALFLTFLLVGFGLVTMQQCHRNLLGTCLQEATALPTFALRPGILQLVFANAVSTARFRIAADLGQAPPSVMDLDPHGRRRVELTVAAPARGWVHVDRLRLTTTHPFGLFRAWAWVHTPLRMVVYPRPVGALPMPADDANRSGKLAKGGAGADEWLGLRPFRDGDSPRQVDWKAYAREAPLLVKEYSSSGGELRMFRFQQMDRLSVEQRLEQMARWVVDAEAQGERYGIELPATRIPPDRGPEHRHQCLRALAVHGLREAPAG